VLGDEHGEEVLHFIFGRHAVQRVEGLFPIAGDEGIECIFIGRQVLIAQHARRQQLAHFQGRQHSLRTNPRHAANAGLVRHELAASNLRSRFIEQDRRVQHFGEVFQS
jgi:hypothetical protein